MAWSTDGSNTAPSTLHVTNTAPFSHRITQQTYATVFYSVIRAKTDLRRSPSSLRVGLVYVGKLWQGGAVGGLFKSSTFSAISCAPQEVQLGRSLFYQSLFDSVLIMYFNNIATCLGVTFLYWGMCKVTPHFGCSSVADVYRYITA